MSEKEIILELEKWRGYSAYEVAVKNGFDGTEAEWLASLAGGTLQIKVCGKTVDASGNIILYADDIKMGEGTLNTVKTMLDELASKTGAFTPTEDGIDLGGKYIDNALFR